MLGCWVAGLLLGWTLPPNERGEGGVGSAGRKALIPSSDRSIQEADGGLHVCISVGGLFMLFRFILFTEDV